MATIRIIKGRIYHRLRLDGPDGQPRAFGRPRLA